MNNPDVTDKPATPAASTPASGSVATEQKPKRIRSWKCGCGLRADELHKINWVRYVQGYAQCKQCRHDLEEY